MRCGSTGNAPEAFVGVVRLLLWWCPRPACEPYLEWRRRTQPATDDREAYLDAWSSWRAQQDDQQSPWVAVLATLTAENRRHRLEVNHIDPVLGRHAESGCHHHLFGLETLCHACHLDETAAQRAAGLLTRATV